MSRDPHYIVVGAGAAGGVMAARLSEDREKRVLLLEAGVDYERDGSNEGLPDAIRYGYGKPDNPGPAEVRGHHWYPDAADPHGLAAAVNAAGLYGYTGSGDARHAVDIPRGRIIGGTTSVNSQMWVRGTTEDFDYWSTELGCESWSFDNVLPRFALQGRERTQTHWRTHHYAWLERTIAGYTRSLKVNLSLLFRQLKNLDEILAAYGEQVEELAAATRYREPVKALTRYKGIKHLFALTMITEIGDVKRFAHPRELVSWAGMDIREYASGGKSNRLGVTRQGNRYLRTAFIEANQRGYRSAIISKDVKARRAKSPSKYVAIADRCLRRLNKNGNRPLLAGKHPNKVKVACAREMVGFVWESFTTRFGSGDEIQVGNWGVDMSHFNRAFLSKPMT